MVAPADGFYASPLGKSEIRIAYVLKEEDLRAAVRLLAIALERYSAQLATVAAADNVLETESGAASEGAA